MVSVKASSIAAIVAAAVVAVVAVVASEPAWQGESCNNEDEVSFLQEFVKARRTQLQLLAAAAPESSDAPADSSAKLETAAAPDSSEVSDAPADSSAKSEAAAAPDSSEVSQDPEAQASQQKKDAFETMKDILHSANLDVTKSEALVKDMRRVATTMRNMFGTLSSDAVRLKRISQHDFSELDIISRTTLITETEKSEKIMAKIDLLLTNFSQEAIKVAVNLETVGKTLQDNVRGFSSEVTATSMGNGTSVITSAIRNMSENVLKGKQALDDSKSPGNATNANVSEILKADGPNMLHPLSDTSKASANTSSKKDDASNTVTKDIAGAGSSNILNADGLNKLPAGAQKQLKNLVANLKNSSTVHNLSGKVSEALQATEPKGLHYGIKASKALLHKGLENLISLQDDCQSLSDKVTSSIHEKLPVLPNALGGKLKMSTIGDIGNAAEACSNLRASTETFVQGLQKYLDIAESYLPNEHSAAHPVHSFSVRMLLIVTALVTTFIASF